MLKAQISKVLKNVPTYPDAASRFELAMITTLLLLLIVTTSLWFVRIPVTILGIYGVVFKPWRNSSLFWLTIFTFLIFECYYLWHTQDNHKYLIAYWCLAIGLANATSSIYAFIANNARILIGLCFLLAVVAKVLSPSYMDSTFFRVTLMSDPRFRPMAARVVGVEEEAFTTNFKAMSELTNEDGPTNLEVTTPDTPKLRLASWSMTIWTLIIETAIAVTFLVPFGNRLSRFRNYLLCVFVLSTYAVANVIGFGWVLSVMGIAQLRDNEHHFASVYFLLIVILHVYRVPWSVLTQF